MVLPALIGEEQCMKPHLKQSPVKHRNVSPVAFSVPSLDSERSPDISLQVSSDIIVIIV